MSGPQNVTIIDSRVGDIAAVIASLPSGERVFVLDGAHDGLDQIAALLAGISDIGALHIVAHGSAGSLTLGSGRIDAAALARHADDLAAIGQHMASGGDILLYGCDVATGEAGLSFVTAFAGLTGADIAASTDVTGASVLGGNWTLEAHVGAIEARSLAIAGFHGTLDTVDGTSGADVLTGTAGDDIINGLGGNDTISGLDGNDVINGGIGNDAMTGGLGDDVYYVDSLGDTVIEAAGEGTDTVYSALSLVLGVNVENLVLLGTGPLSGVGNTLDNAITGNSGDNLLNGGAGNDVLDGGSGSDTLIGGVGNDTYVVDQAGDSVFENASEGRDTVNAAISYALGQNIDNLVLTGTSDINGVGNVLNNSLTGNAGNNILTGEDGSDILDGGAGADTLIGGTGNDTYIVDHSGEILIEQAAQGIDTVKAAITYTLLADFENLVLTGVDTIDGSGNDVGNMVTGNDAANTLSGLGGNDTLDGGLGGDTLIGGLGNDTYVVDSAGDAVVDQVDEGTDTVLASVSYVLLSNTENLTLTGTDLTDGTGNALDNLLTGNDSANTLTGLLGNDTLDGGGGADSLAGGQGDDTYVVDNAGDVTTEAVGEGTDTVLSGVDRTLGDNFENLVLTGTAALNGTGNALDNTISGNLASNILDGGAGADTLVGGLGGDTYYVDNVLDVVTETAQGAGTDTVIASVSYVLSANVDALTLVGTADLAATGNNLANRITGNSGNNVIDGGGGKDILDGLDGSDMYYIASSNQHYVGEIHDSGAAGLDEVRVASLTAGQVSFGASDTGIEKIVIGTGTGAAADATGVTAISIVASKIQNGLTITGNAGVNAITGTAFNDIIDGGAGVDRMAGGKGDDTYYVDDIKDRVAERTNEGTDIVNASVSFTLGKGVEVLNLTGADDTSGFGGADANTLNGTSGNNWLDGGKGNDILKGFGGNDTLIGGFGSDSLEGGSGADMFLFKYKPKVADGFDIIADFSSAEGDTIALTKAAFRGLGSVLGQLQPDQFWSGAGVDTAHTFADRILYNTTTGNLWYDSDGLGAIAPVLIAQLGAGSHPALAYTDIYLIA